MVNVTSLQSINMKDSLEEEEFPWAFGGTITWQHPVEWKFSEWVEKEALKTKTGLA